MTSTDDDTGVSVDLGLARFVEDVGVTGQGRYDFETSTIDANVALAVPGSFGQVQVSGVWFGPGATKLPSTARSAAAASSWRYRRRSPVLAVPGP